jgi:hypothetical protein
MRKSMIIPNVSLTRLKRRNIGSTLNGLPHDDDAPNPMVGDFLFFHKNIFFFFEAKPKTLGGEVLSTSSGGLIPASFGGLVEMVTPWFTDA